MNAKEKIVARIAEYDKRIAIRQNNSCYHDETAAVKSFNDRAHGLEEALVILAECEKDKDVASMKSPEEIRERRGQIKIDIEKRMDNWQAIACEGGFRDALDWVLGVEE